MFEALALLCLALPTTAVQAAPAADEPRLTAANLNGLALRNLGPALMSGRIADVVLDPRNARTWYVGVGSGGVWKTVNAGTTWTPLFDGESAYSIGCLALDPSNPETVWVGTGENVGGRHVGFGDGVYKSQDGGASWQRMGLEKSEHVGMIAVDPRDSNVVWVAAQGPLWSPGGERGVYKSVDGGASWQQVLAAGEFTGANEVHLDPRDPDVVYAVLHQRFRDVAALIDGGPESGIHKSTDGGRTWRELTRGLPEEDMGKIGLALSPQDQGVVYAAIELARRTGGFYRSSDGGESWEKRSDAVAGGTGPHYYQEVFASPHAFDRVYLSDVRMQVSDDGGRTFRRMGESNKHSDNHALAFDPNDPDYLLVGCDGGLYESFDLAKTWRFLDNLPVTQFYKVALDVDQPFYNVYGGTQDNSTQGGPSRTDNENGIRNADWFITLFADGHQPATDPSNPDILYSEWQEGNLVRYDRRTGEIVYVQPQPAKGEPEERFNWDAPILVSPHDPARLYYASQRVWRSDDRGDSWRPVSGDLSAGVDRTLRPYMGRVWSVDSPWDLFAMSKYGTVTSLAESPVQEGLLYAGTDDGRIQVSEDGGGSWRAVESLPGVPAGFFVNDVKADLFDAGTVYACVDQHKSGDFRPYVLKSTDRGRTWSAITGDLPERTLCWRLVQDHVVPKLLFLGTEFGLYTSLDGGAHWIELTGGVPTIPFRDLAIQRRENDLVGATFGRGFFVLDDYTPLRAISEASLAEEAQLFQPRDAWWYVPKRPLAGGGKAYQGDAYFVAPNPPFGAVFTYWLRDGYTSKADARKKAEKERAKAGEDTPRPDWDALREERLESPPAVLLSVRDASGALVRRLEGPLEAGLHRLAWDLRYAPLEAAPADADDEDAGGGGTLAPPGRYTVALAKRIDGVETALGAPQTFEVVPLRAGTLPGAGEAARAAFAARLDAARERLRAVEMSVGERFDELKAITEALARARTDDAALRAEVQALTRAFADLDLDLHGDEERAYFQTPGRVSLARRVDVAVTGTRFSTYGPTPNLEGSLAIAEEGLAAMVTALDGPLQARMDALYAALAKAGVPWTPGRKIGG